MVKLHPDRPRIIRSDRAMPLRRPHGFRNYIKRRGYHSIYLIASWHGKAVSPVKIGIADDPVRRFGAIQSSNPVELVIYMHWWVAGRPVAARVEAAFKERHKDRKIRGEWFDIGPDEATKLMVQALNHIGAWGAAESSLIRKMQKEEDNLLNSLSGRT